MALTNDEKNIIRDFKEIVARETATDGDKLIIKGLGTFERKTTNEKSGRNPQTGDTITIPARSVLRFKASTTTRREV